MFCEKCGNNLPEGAKFCNKCGAVIENNAEIKTQPLVGEDILSENNPSKNSDEHAGFWLRLGAFFIDYVAIILMAYFIGYTFNPNLGGINDQLLGTILIIGYHVVALSLFSTTIGKKLFGLRVVDSITYEKIRFGKAIGRTFLYIISSLFFFLGFIMIAFNKDKQGWHDQMAGTLVLKKKDFNITMGVIIAFISFIIAMYIIYGDEFSSTDSAAQNTTMQQNQTSTAEVASDEQKTNPVAEADYNEGYKSGYVDGRSLKGNLGDNYAEPATEERKDAYFAGYLDGFLKGCREGNFDCSEVENAINSLGQDSETTVNLIPSTVN